MGFLLKGLGGIMKIGKLAILSLMGFVSVASASSYTGPSSIVGMPPPSRDDIRINHITSASSTATIPDRAVTGSSASPATISVAGVPDRSLRGAPAQASGIAGVPDRGVGANIPMGGQGAMMVPANNASNMGAMGGDMQPPLGTMPPPGMMQPPQQ